MTQDEIIEMAKEAGLDIDVYDYFFGYSVNGTHKNLEDFAKLVAAKKQEDIIQIIKETPFSNWFQAVVIEAINASGEQA